MPDTPADTRPVVAAFDVDGTLTTRDCVKPFLRRAAGWRLVSTILGHPVAVVGAAARLDRDRLKELACAALRGLDAAAFDELGRTFAREVATSWLRDDTTARLRRHRELGHRVILASASLDAYLDPLGDMLEVDGVVCTRLERGLNGTLTGRLVGENCRGAEKARRVGAWLEAAGLADAVLWAYGDAPGDRPLLEAADHAVWVGAERLSQEPG